ncbi:magnesium transporter CorA family protein [Endomicrobium proavitum]|uniref:Putative Mg2+/Co2+ transport protein CorA n=1 Tax=Endomicrobium proavitum TaxID=1408281 RepID=A0A0G3WIR1_9BACT|nr:magnesium transporter CorA family protein [Endomicrobium proavitum]AKL98203.1 putative Mg2+/Co2+ transport protein CorA [Endomicrobium proavitum]
MIKAIYSVKNKFYVEEDAIKIAEIYKKKPQLMWIDIHLESHEFTRDETMLLTGAMKFHEMSLEDCLFPQYYPKMEEFENYVFGALHGIQLKPKYYEDFDDSIYELNLFIGKNFIVTVHIEELFFLETLFEKTKARPGVELKSAVNLLYNIFGKVISSYESTLEKIDDKMEDLEDEILENPETENVEEILNTKKVIFAMRKIAESQQMAYAYFTRLNPDNLVKKENLVYFRDIFTQCLRVNQSIVMRSQVVVSLLEVYMSSVTVRLTVVMKFLTIIATLLMPVLIVSGYFGMNVRFPEYSFFGEDGSWYFAVSIIIAAVVAMIIYFKKKKWF